MSNDAYILHSQKITELKKKYEALKKCYEDNILTQNYYNNLLTKVLVIASASFFEEKIMEFIKTQIKESNTKDIINSFSQVGIERKYFTWFDFSTNNPKLYKGIYQFLKYFGDNFKTKIQKIIDANKSNEQEKLSSFIKIVSLRNKLVHSDFMATDGLGEITFDEIYKDHEHSIDGWKFLMKEIVEYTP